MVQELVSLSDVPLDLAAETTCMNCHDKCGDVCQKSPEFKEQAARFVETEEKMDRLASLAAACGVRAQAGHASVRMRF